MRIRNFKSLRDIEIDNFGNFCIFIGKNNSGKSAVLQVLRLLSGKPVNVPIKEFITNGQESSYVEMIFSLKDERKNIIEMFSDTKRPELEHSRFFHEMKCDFEIIEEKKNYLTNIYVSDVNGEFVNILEIKDNRVHLVPIETMNTKIRVEGNIHAVGKTTLSTGADDLFSVRGQGSKFFYIKQLGDFLGGLSFLNAARYPRGKHSAKKSKLQETAENLPSVLLDIFTSERESFDKIEKLASKIEPDIEMVKPPLEDTNTYTVLKPKNGAQIKLEHSGKGIEQILAMACLVVTNDNSPVLIEEPEANLHPSAADSLFEFLEEESKKRQIIITTHSTIFADSTDDVKIYLLDKKPDEGTHVMPLKRNELKIIKRVLGVKNRHLFLPELAVLIEGDSEEVTFPEIAKSLRIKSIERGKIELINVTGNGNMISKKIKEYLKYMKDIGFATYIIADREGNVAKEIDDLVREGLLPKDRYYLWKSGAFEDCFSEKMVINAVKKIGSEQGTEVEITEEEFSEEKGTGKGNWKALNDIMHKRGIDLQIKKPELSTAIVSLIKEESKSNPKRRETEPEKVIRILNDVCKKCS